MLSKFLTRLRYLPHPLSLLYPIEWHRIKPAFSSSALTPVKYWLVVIPFIAGVVSLVPIEISIPNAEIIIGGEFTAPFSIKLSYWAAVLYMSSYGLFRLRCPRYVQRLDANFVSLPEKTTRTEIVSEVRKAILDVLPRKIHIEGTTYVRRTGGYLSDEVLGEGEVKALPDDHAKEIILSWHRRADTTEIQMLQECGRRLTVLATDRVDAAFFSETIESHGERFIPKIGGDNESLFNLLFIPDLRILVNSDDKNLIATLTHTGLYLTLSESRSISRMLTFLLLAFSAFLGVIVLLQIIYRGFLLFGLEV